MGLEHFLSLFQGLGAFLGLVGLQLELVRLRANGNHVAGAFIEWKEGRAPARERES